ncbi:hypothetical protein ACA910_013165 [Epithemia clementina (nom. ined.)]
MRRPLASPIPDFFMDSPPTSPPNHSSQQSLTGSVDDQDTCSSSSSIRGQHSEEIPTKVETVRQATAYLSYGLTVVGPNKPMQKAETTRKIEKKNDNNDWNDPETIAGMKSTLDIDRERVARAKANRLLQQGFL